MNRFFYWEGAFFVVASALLVLAPRLAFCIWPEYRSFEPMFPLPVLIYIHILGLLLILSAQGKKNKLIPQTSTQK